MAKKTNGQWSDKKLLTWSIVLLILFWPVGLCMLIYYFTRKGKQKSYPTVANNGASLSFQAAGTYYYLDNLKAAGEKSRAFYIPDAEFLSKYANGKTVYEYYFSGAVGTLVPEPSNPHDKNAIMVTLNGLCVGHVPADLCLYVADLLREKRPYRISARGGPRRYVNNGVVYREDHSFSIYVDFQ